MSLEELKISFKLTNHETCIIARLCSISYISDMFSTLKKSIGFQIIVDTSGSMRTYFNDMRKSLIQYIEFLESGISYLPSDVHIYLNIIHFDSVNKQVYPPLETGYGFKKVEKGTAQVVDQKFPVCCSGFTHMDSVLNTCQKNIWNTIPDGVEIHRILLTDGQPNDTSLHYKYSEQYKNDPNCYNIVDQKIKEDILLKYKSCIETVVGIGSAELYDIKFLSELSRNKSPKVAALSDDIVDTIRESFMLFCSTCVPENCQLKIKKSYISNPFCDVFDLVDDGEYYVINLGKITIAFDVMFSFEPTANFNEIPYQFNSIFNGSPVSIESTIPIQSPVPNDDNIYQMHLIKQKISIVNNEKIDVYNSDKQEERLVILKNIESDIKKYMSIAEDEALKNQWLDILKSVKQMQDFLQIGDFNTYSIYSSTRPSSINISLLRTQSSRPIDPFRLASKAVNSVKYICSICHDSDITPALYKCGHMVCVSCSIKYYVNNGKQCPVCKKDNVANLGSVKLPIFPGNNPSKKCLTKDCPNRYHGFNEPCLHVTSCYDCGMKLTGHKCPFPECKATISKFSYYYSDYEQIS
jgi:hypothetical protein